MSAPLSVLVVIEGLEAGGTEHHLLRVLPRLPARGVQPAVATLGPAGRLAPALVAAGVPVHEPPLAGVLRRLAPRARRGLALPPGAAALSVRLLARRPDVVHFFLPVACLTGAPCALATGHRRLVASRRSLNAYQAGHPLLARLERRLLRAMRAVVGNSRAVFEELAGEGVARERLRLVANGVDVRDFARAPEEARAVRAALGIAPGAFVLVMVANLIAYKGHRDLLAALALARGALPGDWHVLCVGRDDGPLRDLQRRTAALGLADRVAFLGERDDVPALLGAADLAVHCSHQEGSSNAVLEAMASGLAVVATDAGGNREAVVHGETGLLVPVGDPPALAAAVGELAADAARRRTMGRAGRARVAAEFSLDACADAYARLYREVLDVRG